ncbi:MAG: CdaR family protein [Anaerotignaceae bacterium]
MNKFFNYLMKDLGWKLLSLAIAISLWFVVINLEDPVENRSYTAELQVRNEATLTDRNQVASNLHSVAGTRVTIKVRGQRTYLDRLNQVRGDIQAYIDLSTLDETAGLGEEILVPVVIQLPSFLSDNIEIESRSISNAVLVIENTVTKEMDVALDILGGTGSSYAMVTPEVTPSTVSVFGTYTNVEKVVTVRTIIELQNATEDTNISTRIIPYDEYGNEVFDVTVTPDTADIYIPVRMSKKVNIVANTIGEPANGFAVDAVTITPSYVYVIGDDEALASINEIHLPNINVEGKEEDVTMTFSTKYLLNSGLTLKSEGEERTVVTVSIVPMETKLVTFTSDNISYIVENLDDNYIATVEPATIEIEVQGHSRTLETFTAEDIQGRIVINDLGEGEHTLPIQLTLPEGISLTNGEPPYITILITQTEAQTDVEENTENITEENIETN